MIQLQTMVNAAHRACRPHQGVVARTTVGVGTVAADTADHRAGYSPGCTAGCTAEGQSS